MTFVSILLDNNQMIMNKRNQNGEMNPSKKIRTSLVNAIELCYRLLNAPLLLSQKRAKLIKNLSHKVKVVTSHFLTFFPSFSSYDILYLIFFKVGIKLFITYVKPQNLKFMLEKLRKSI